jgi:hypothetical protein
MIVAWRGLAVREHVVRHLVVVVAAAGLVAGCAPKLTTQQALVEEAFKACQPQGPSTKLEKVQPDGKFSVVGREAEAQRVHDCMVRFDQAERRDPRAAAPPAPPAPAVTPPAAVTTQPLVAGRLPGTWRGTLRLPPRAAGETEIASPATMRFTVVAGAIRWTLSSGTGSAVAADGSALVVDNELRMTGSVHGGAGRAAPANGRPVGVRYAGTLVGDRLEVTGVTADQQVHMISVRRVTE